MIIHIKIILKYDFRREALLRAFCFAALRWVLNLLGQSYFCSSSGHILSILNFRVSLESEFFTLLMVHRNFRFFKNCRFFAGFSLKLSVASDLIRRVLMISELFFIVQEVPVAAPGLIRRLLMISELFYIVQEDLEAASGLFKSHSVL